MSTKHTLLLCLVFYIVGVSSEFKLDDAEANGLSLESQDKTSHIAKRDLVQTTTHFVTFAYFGAYEIAKVASQKFLNFIISLYRYLTRLTPKLLPVLKRSVAVALRVTKRVCRKLVGFVAKALNLTFLVSAETKEKLLASVKSLIPKSGKLITAGLNAIKNAVSKFYDLVKDIVDFVLKTPAKWEKTKLEIAEKAKVKGGKTLSPEELMVLNAKLEAKQVPNATAGK